MTKATASERVTRRLLGQFEEVMDDPPPAIDIRLVGREDGIHDAAEHGQLGPPTRAEYGRALLTALSEHATGAFIAVAPDGVEVIRVPMRSRAAIEQVLIRLPQLRGELTPAELDD
jgi:hypothetical protein